MLINKLKVQENIEYFDQMRAWAHWVSTLNYIEADGQPIKVELLDSHVGENSITIRLYYDGRYITSIYCYPCRECCLDDAWSLSAALDIMHEMAR